VNGNKSILIVDDSKAVRQLLGMFMTKNVPCTITEACDGQEALEIFKEADFDLVITDINMPRMNGLDFIRAIRKDLEKSVPIIIVTTMGAEEDRDTGIKLGANSYVTKPVNGMNLMQVVSTLI
jgi:two-component system chemotaxis response regulator CheY